MERDEIAIEQLFKGKDFIGPDTYTDYGMLYKQPSTEIHRKIL